MNKQYLSSMISDILCIDEFNLENIKYFQKDKVLDITLSLKEIVVFDKFNKLQNSIKSELPILNNVIIRKKYNLDRNQFEELFEIYWEDIIERLTAKFPSLSAILTSSSFKRVGDGMELHIADIMGYQSILSRNIDRMINKVLQSELEFEFPIDFICDEDTYEKDLIKFEEEKQNIIKEKEKEIQEAARQANKNSSNNSSANATNNYSNSKGKKTEADECVIYRKKITSTPVSINEGMQEETYQCFEVEVFDIDSRQLKNKNNLLVLSVTDRTNSIGVKVFLKDNELEEVLERVKKGSYILVDGKIRYDSYDKELALFASNINSAPKPEERMDTSDEKRVELLMLSNMSEMDGVTSVEKLIKKAHKWGHKAVAITDNGVLQAFPKAQKVSADLGIKMIYGVKAYVIDDDSKLYDEDIQYSFMDSFVVFDIETTGFSPLNDGITEIGAVKVFEGKIVDKYSTFVNPQKPIPPKVTELTGITDDMVKNERTIDRVLPEFLEFCSGSALVAHNASFDMSFIREKARNNNLEVNHIVVDTLQLSKLLLTELKRHKLNQIAKHLGISLENHHRAVDDAYATAEVFVKFIEMMSLENVKVLSDLNRLSRERMDHTKYYPYRATILVKNQEGIKDLYKLVSHSNIKTFYMNPRIPKSLLIEMRENLLIGSACEDGEIFDAIKSGETDEKLLEMASFYDYLEVQPISNQRFLIDKGIAKDDNDLIEFSKRIINIGEKLGKPVVATGNVHFLEPEDEIYRRILMSGKKIRTADTQPPFYFRTTNEMLDEFSYLDEDKRKRIVIDNTNLIADMIDVTKPIPSETYPPIIEGSDTELREMCYKKARRIYGEELPEIVEKRLERELSSIIGNGYAVMYIIAQKLVTKSLEDGYLVGSRGSVGSSLAATMSDITEVNPLPPHYVCKNCKSYDFTKIEGVYSGFDLPDKTCPKCGEAYYKDGNDIPFEVFLGFEGDKEPDIDLNFAGVYQGTSHKYTEELFGEGYTYKAGTIGGVADKTAFGFVKKYFEEREIPINSKEVNRLSLGCTGVKRTTGQHPGGIMVVPDYKEIYDFCPIQYPANDVKCGVITTHFDYHSLSGKILKLDILGHDVPTIIKNLEEMTGVNIQDVPLDDKETMSIFTSVEALKVLDDEYKETIGSLGIPEFGTKFVRQMLTDTQPTTFDELVRISGLSHGTDVWLNNAQDLVRNGTTSLKYVIATRDDIMNYLISMGLPNKEAFTIMERVRKGKGLTDENIEFMKQNNVPEWYIWSCNQIKYMFPKAHAVAYVMMSFRIAYFKVNYPREFYATYFSTKVDDFDANLISKGQKAIKEKMKALENQENSMTKKESDLYTILEVASEMYSRGYKVAKVDLYESHASEFKILNGEILPPLQSLQGLGSIVAQNIADERHNEFLSIEDIKKRCKASKTVIEALQEHGCINGLPETNQLSLF